MRGRITALFVSIHPLVSSQVTVAALISTRLISVRRAGISRLARLRPHLHPQQRRASIHLLRKCWQVIGAMVLIARQGLPRLVMTTIRYRRP